MSFLDSCICVEFNIHSGGLWTDLGVVALSYGWLHNHLRLEYILIGVLRFERAVKIVRLVTLSLNSVLILCCIFLHLSVATNLFDIPVVRLGLRLDKICLTDVYRLKCTLVLLFFFRSRPSPSRTWEVCALDLWIVLIILFNLNRKWLP